MIRIRPYESGDWEGVWSVLEPVFREGETYARHAGAVRLWRQLGFGIVGTLPAAFRHPRLGPVDAHVMYKLLEGPDS